MIIEVFPQKIFDKEQIKRSGSVTTECVQGSLNAASFRQYTSICGSIFLEKIKTVKGTMIVSAFGLCFTILVQATYCSISHICGC